MSLMKFKGWQMVNKKGGTMNALLEENYEGNEDWVLLDLDFFRKITQLKLTGEQSSILFCLIGTINRQGVSEKAQKDIAEITGIKQQNISRSIKELEKKGVVVKIKRGTANAYAINPNFTTASCMKRKQESKVIQFKKVSV